jgi:hypothetical protein
VAQTVTGHGRLQFWVRCVVVSGKRRAHPNGNVILDIFTKITIPSGRFLLFFAFITNFTKCMISRGIMPLVIHSM